jgi:hypothetical protein
VIAKDSLRDLAVIQLPSLPPEVKEVTLAPTSPEPGETVHSIGNSALADNGMLWRYTRGNVGLVYQKKTGTPTGTVRIRMVETQSPVNKGDSGGPVVDNQGRLVGVTASYAAEERLVSQSTDAQEVKDFVARVLATKTNEANRSTEVVKTSVEQEGKSHANSLVNRPSVVGRWNFTATNADGQEMTGEGQFRRDETFRLSSSLGPPTNHKVRQGRFAYANGVLWMILGERSVIMPLTWINTDRFVCSSHAVEFTFDRQTPQSAS